MENSIYNTLTQAFPNVVFKENEALAPHTYFKIGGRAEVFFLAKTRDELINVSSFCKKHDIPLIVLGGASNVLISDEGVNGLVIKNETNGITATKLDENTYELDVDSGLQTNILVRKAIDLGLEGLEFFSGVPGSVGGAIYNNSHYATELFGSYVHSVSVVDDAGELVTRPASELRFAYDFSAFQETKEIIISAKLHLVTGNKEEVEQRARDSNAHRARTQPLGVPSSGCMFQNVHVPPELRDKFDGREVVSAGWLIDQTGLKGMRVGDAIVSEKHANFILNVGHASAKDINALVKIVQDKVFEKFGLRLKQEVFFI